MGEQIEFLSNHCKEHGIEHEIIDTQIFDLAGEKNKKEFFILFIFFKNEKRIFVHNSFRARLQ